MRSPDHTRRVAVTGLGVISPVGNDKDTAWSNLVNGVSGLGEITRFDISQYEHKAGGEVHDFEPTAWMDAKAVRRSEHEMHFGVAAARPRPRVVQPLFEASVRVVPNALALRGLQLLGRGV